MKKTKKIPLRKCLGCAVQFPKKELIRVVKNKEGSVFVDKTGRANGRGAYLCHNAECLKKALKRKAIQRALDIALSPQIEAELEASIENDDK